MNRSGLGVLVILLCGVSWRPAARADDSEASLGIDLGGAGMRVEDAQDLDGAAIVPGARAMVRGSYGVSDRVALEVQLGFLAANAAEYTDRMHLDRTGTLRQDERAVRLTAGATLRLGVRWIPTLSAHVGYQHRWITEACIAQGSCIETLPSRGVNDLLVVLGVGLDYRISARWVVGISALAVHAFNLEGNSYDAVEVPLSVSWYWYPWW